ncbi:YuzD family protein [Aquibacillus kalidii]|uniref:YuzD family protein n=1 Tax=Aquibacillus kalidii TaxID=2762597 RepID=UPI0016452579|nr:YuzD family protein [Aquibacillus kalidii]
MVKRIKLTVYGSKQICASCVGAPNSVDTYEWLQAAISRKYQDEIIDYQYVDINEPPDSKEHIEFVEEILENDLFYPIILVNNDIVAEGIPQLKKITQALEEEGILLRA